MTVNCIFKWKKVNREGERSKDLIPCFRALEGSGTSKQTKENCGTRKVSSLIYWITIGNKRTEAASSFLFGWKLYYMQFLITCRTFILHLKAKSIVMIWEIIFIFHLTHNFLDCMHFKKSKRKIWIQWTVILIFIKLSLKSISRGILVLLVSEQVFYFLNIINSN